MNDKRVNDLGDYSDICAFVPQNDIMLPNFTVFELLFFYARLKLPRKTTNRECFVMAQEVINCLGLAHIRHSIIGDAVSEQAQKSQVREHARLARPRPVAGKRHGERFHANVAYSAARATFVGMGG